MEGRNVVVETVDENGGEREKVGGGFIVQGVRVYTG